MRGECLKTSSTRQWTRLSERQLSSRFAHLRTQALIGAVILPVSCAAGAAGVGLSTLELLGKVADTPPEKRLDIQKVDEDDEFSWNVSTAVSFIPGFNWMAWIMAAISSEESARRFYVFAVLYAPGALYSLLQFPDLDKTSVFLYLICALHIQVEMMSDIDRRSAALALESLPAGRDALLGAANGLKKRFSALMEALDYSIQKELEENSTKLPYREQKLLEEDEKLQKELRETEMSTWDEKLKRGRMRARNWGPWGSDKHQHK